MCKLLEVSRSNYYYEINRIEHEDETSDDEAVIKAFDDSKGNYGARKLKIELAKTGMILSRRKIRQIMIKNALVSTYTVLQYKPKKSTSNEQKIENILSRDFDNRNLHEVVVSDLTYVNVSGMWHYICILIDLFNREIIGHSCGPHKDAELVKQAFYKTNIPLNQIRIFHTDRGKEFDNLVIEEILETFHITRSLSRPGNPYDNAVAETTYKTFKTEFCKKRFESLEQLETELFDYVHWYNTKRIHGSLGYLSPVEYRKQMSI
jgi:transposase InsO family protein